MDTTQAIAFFEAVDQHVADRGVLATLAVGASFETWLAFEARLALEANRTVIGIPTHYWAANEYPQKIDLSVCEGDDSVRAAFELKVIHNNKNWGERVKSLHKDLHPEPSSRKALASVGARRWAIAVLVGKLYRPGYGDGYAGPQPIVGWQNKVMAALQGSEAGARVLWTGRRFEIAHPWLDPNQPNFVQLVALTVDQA